MIALQLRFALLVEVLIWLGIAVYGMAFWGWGYLSIPSLLLGGMLAVRTFIIGVTFVCSIVWGAAPPEGLRLSPLATLKLVFKELVAFVLTSVVFMPFERRWIPHDRIEGRRQARTPIVLIHGYRCNRGTWVRLHAALRRAGWPVLTVNLEPAGASIASFAKQLARRIDEALLESGTERVILIGHSMGGLVARHYVARFGDGAVRAVITLGTPHHGTEIARLGVGACAQEMLPGSTFLRELPGSIAVPLVSIYSAHDNFIMPQGPCGVTGARNVAMAGVGHIHMTYSRRVINHVLRELAGV